MIRRNKSGLFTVVIILLLSGIFVGMLAYGTASVLSMEGKYPPYEYEKSKSKAPETKQELTELVSFALKAACESGARLEAETWLDLGSNLQNSLTVQKNQKLKELILFNRKYIGREIDKQLPQANCDFGQSFEGVLAVPALTPDDIEEFTVDWLYYQCPDCGATEESACTLCEKCGAEKSFTEKYKDKYTVYVTLKHDLELPDSSFYGLNAESLTGLFDGAFAQYGKFTALNAQTKAYSMKFEINRVTDAMSYFEYSETAEAELNVKLNGVYEDVGEDTLSFTLTETNGNKFIYPGIALDSSYESVEPRGSVSLNARVTYKEGGAGELVWSSSDEAVAKVDNSGYVKVGKTPGEAVITVSTELDGKAYTDSCVISVKTPVERTSISKRKVKLSVGGQILLEPKIAPKKATVKTVKWYSEDESIACVDENGLVTAVGKGQVTVYFLSDDGYFKSSCEVTVNE